MSSSGSGMSPFERRLRELQAGLARAPADPELKAMLERWIDEHPAELAALMPPETLAFGIRPEKQPRRLQFLKHLLLNGYLPPRVEEHGGAPWTTATVNLGIITGYFYANALSLLEAGLARSDVAVFVAYPAPAGDEAWIEAISEGEGAGVRFHAALMLDPDGLVWRRFHEPVPMHYLFPVDNYYRSKFRLVAEYGAYGVPMPGSTIIRQVCENKVLLADIAGNIPGLRLARESRLRRADDEDVRAEALDRFCAEHDLRALVTKPVDGFGGAGIRFWEYPAGRDALLRHARDALTVRDELLVQERIVAAPTRSGREWNLRQYVLREGPAAIRASWKRVRIGHGVINTTQGARSTTIEELLDEIALQGAERDAFVATLRSTDDLAVEVLRALEDYLHRQWSRARRPYRGSGSNLEPDLLALDFMIARAAGHPGGFAVYLNEINDFASGGMRDYELLVHRQVFPDADAVRATHAFSLAPHVLQTARWRGGAYKEAINNP